MTIHELNALTALTSTDELPVWDAEASGEPTKKITAQNMAASVKSLASLPNTTEMNTAIQQSTAPVDIRNGYTLASKYSGYIFSAYRTGKIVVITLASDNPVSITDNDVVLTINDNNLKPVSGYGYAVFRAGAEAGVLVYNSGMSSWQVWTSKVINNRLMTQIVYIIA